MAANRDNLWVSQRESEDWAVKREGGEKASRLFDTQQQAFEYARDIARQAGGEVIVKNTKGVIREKNTYGKKDPFPPRG